MYPSVLFIVKKRNQSWGQRLPYGSHSSGLLNSATFVCKMLQGSGVKAHLVEVVDGNDIDREVFKHNPKLVILEAIWCAPSKLLEVSRLRHHAGRHWVVRNHSELPFLAQEGTSIQWLLEYPMIPRVTVACNSPVACEEVEELLRIRYYWEVPVLFLPNYYHVGHPVRHRTRDHHGVLNVGCFGAIRPLKNHLTQAVAAILYADTVGQHLHFHVNAGRLECNGDPVLKSLRAVFAESHAHKLVEHVWLNWPEFVNLCRTMDMGLQVSFSESFNIVSADLVSQGVPVVSSDELPWMPAAYHADPASALSIVRKMHVARREGAGKQAMALREYSRESRDVWLATLRQ